MGERWVAGARAKDELRRQPGCSVLGANRLTAPPPRMEAALADAHAQLNAVVTVLPDASGCPAPGPAQPEPGGLPLAGVAVVVKDNIDVEGVVTTNASSVGVPAAAAADMGEPQSCWPPPAAAAEDRASSDGCEPLFPQPCRSPPAAAADDVAPPACCE